MQAIALIQAELNPQLERLINYLKLTGHVGAAAFFRDAKHRVGVMRAEDDLAELFMVLSTTALQRFDLDPYAAQVVDVMLMRAQHYALTLSADSASRH